MMEALIVCPQLRKVRRRTQLPGLLPLTPYKPHSNSVHGLSLNLCICVYIQTYVDRPKGVHGFFLSLGIFVYVYIYIRTYVDRPKGHPHAKVLTPFQAFSWGGVRRWEPPAHCQRLLLGARAVATESQGCMGFVRGCIVISKLTDTHACIHKNCRTYIYIHLHADFSCIHYLLH